MKVSLTPFPLNIWKAVASLVLLLAATIHGFLPAVYGATEPLRVVVIADLNGSYGSTQYSTAVTGAVKKIIALQPDLVISTGDMVGGQRIPHLQKKKILAMWRSFHESVTEPLKKAQLPLAVTPGNHDGSAYHGFEPERKIYADQWSHRRPELTFIDDSGYPFYYAFSLRDRLFISLDATTVGALTDQQMEWLEETLTRHGSKYRQRIVFSHVPLWPFAKGRESEFIGDPELERLLVQHKVDLYLSGHHHAFYPGEKDGIAFVSQSCLGAGPRKLIGDTEHSPRSMTLIEFSGDDIRIAALKAPDYDRSISWSTLPKEIKSNAATVFRADRSGNNVQEISK